MSKLREILDELRGESALTEDDYQTAVRELDECQHIQSSSAALPWRPIEELQRSVGKPDIYGDEHGFLILAPELIDEDCNVHGVGMGYFQDDRDVPSDEHGAIREEGVEYGGWLACKWSMTNDEWSHVPCTPTHYLRLRGAT